MTCFDSNITSTTIELDVTRLTFDIIMHFLVILTNITILTVAIRRWTLEGLPYGYVMSSLLVVNLSAADLLVGISSVLYYMPRYYCGLATFLATSKNLCLLRFTTKILGHLSSSYTLVAIAIDRYLAVKSPLKYQTMTTPLHSICAILSVWILALMCSNLLFLWNTWNGTSCTEASVIPLAFHLTIGLSSEVAIIVAFSSAHLAIHRKVLKIRKTPITNGNATGGAYVQDDRVGTRASRMLALILSVNISSWAPLLTVLIISKTNVHVPRIVLETASSFVNCNYVINPFIYAYNNRTIKAAIQRSVSSFRRRKSCVDL